MNGKIAIFLTIIFISVGFRDVFTILSFYGNQTYIIENLCVNINDPGVMCYGKCYLADQLEEDHRQEDESPTNRLFDHFELKVVCTNDSLPRLRDDSIVQDTFRESKSVLYHSNYYAKIFQPPDRLSLLS